jgi:hypothetical protein
MEEARFLRMMLRNLQFLYELDEQVILPLLQEVSAISKIHPVEFLFRIPHQLVSNQPVQDSRFLELYPSVKLGTGVQLVPSAYLERIPVYRI